jgi:hypothetical protein
VTLDIIQKPDLSDHQPEPNCISSEILLHFAANGNYLSFPSFRLTLLPVEIGNPDLQVGFHSNCDGQQISKNELTVKNSVESHVFWAQGLGDKLSVIANVETQFTEGIRFSGQYYSP